MHVGGVARVEEGTYVRLGGMEEVKGVRLGFVYFILGGY